MICPNLRIGAPSSTGTTAILWPFGTRWRALTPAGSEPAAMSSIAMITLSEGSRRRARGVVMIVIFWLGGLSYGEKSSGCRFARSSSRAAVILRCCFIASRAASGSPASIAAAIAACSFRLRAKLPRRRHSQPARSFQMDAQRRRGHRWRAPSLSGRSISDGTPRRARKTSLDPSRRPPRLPA